MAKNWKNPVLKEQLTGIAGMKVKKCYFFAFDWIYFIYLFIIIYFIYSCICTLAEKKANSKIQESLISSTLVHRYNMFPTLSGLFFFLQISGENSSTWNTLNKYNICLIIIQNLKVTSIWCNGLWHQMKTKFPSSDKCGQLKVDSSGK